MKRLGMILLVIVAAWASTLLLVPRVATPMISDFYKECNEGEYFDETTCDSRFSRLGQTGDLFGATTSLFSALGLFAVAFSVWRESRSTRVSKKPLVVCTVEQDGITLDRPDFHHKSIRISIDSSIHNLGEPALNVGIQATISTPKRNIKFKETYLPLPLATSGEQRLDIKLVLQNDEFTDFINALQHPNEPTQLKVAISYSSLEQVAWETSVTYTLDCEMHGKNLLSALQGNSFEQFESHWANGAIAPVEATVTPNSWKHASTRIT